MTATLINPVHTYVKNLEQLNGLSLNLKLQIFAINCRAEGISLKSENFNDHYRGRIFFRKLSIGRRWEIIIKMNVTYDAAC